MGEKAELGEYQEIGARSCRTLWTFLKTPLTSWQPPLFPNADASVHVYAKLAAQHEWMCGGEREEEPA